jgi:Flp pilus assembly protein TadD
VASASPAEPAAPTAASLISEAKRAAVQNNRKEAVKFLEQARRLDPKNAEVNQLLFSNYRALGNTLRASEAVKRYLALKPNDSHRDDYEKWLEQNATP